MESIDFSNFIENCDTGDLLLFNSTAFYSRFIELFSRSKYSHIGYIIKNPTWLHPDLSGIFLFESGAECTKDVLSQHKIFGVQLTPMEEIVKQYRSATYGYIYYVQNKFDRTNDYYENLKNVILKTDTKKYDLNPIDWIKADFDINIGIRKVDKFFCSALVGYIMEEVGHLDKNIDWTYIAPRRYSKNAKDILPFINCEIMPEKYINF
jgi:hypothetical protein